LAQVLKAEIRQNIYDAALEAFYEKDFLSATMKAIASKANIPVGLVYSYYKNKAALFDEIVDTVLIDITDILREEERETGKPSDNFEKVGESTLLKWFGDHKRIVILMDKSKGTKHEQARDELVAIIEEHIRTSFSKRCQEDYESAFIHILASNFVESILEIARHYKSEEWAQDMLNLVSKAYFEGVNAL
jgi:AcrR family transcriptional regulator